MSIFSKETLDFLKEVKKNNSKVWFEENKGWYHEDVLSPLKNLVNQLSGTLFEIDGDINVEAKKAISRIYRDTRFSKDKSLYKDRMWLQFNRRVDDKLDYPAFFFQITPYYFSYGMGFFSASVDSMNAFREMVDLDNKKFRKIIDELEGRNIFIPEGDMYKRNRYEGNDEKIKDWYNRKNLYLIYNSEDIDELFKESFVEDLKEGYLLLAPLYHYFIQALAEFK